MDKPAFNQITQRLKPAASDSKTPSGLNNPERERQAGSDQIRAINQIFELFRFNYHNQFLKAFPDLDTLNMAKRLWLKLLADYSGEVIMRAAERTVKETSWLPTVHQVLSRCDIADTEGVPNAYQAYLEACRASSPKVEYAWSHPIVYHAGRITEWFFLANQPEKTAFPVFERNYQILLERLHRGESLSIDIPPALPESIHQPVSKEQQAIFLDELSRFFEKQG